MPEILKLVNFYYSKLHFYQTTAEKEKVYHVNPKRAQRLARKATQKKAIGTKAQQALKKTIWAVKDSQEKGKEG